MRRKELILLGAILFIGLNMLLIYLDDEGKVDRLAYINDWSEAKEADIAEKLYKPGILTAVEETPVYFDQNLGEFQEFLVEEGEEVTTGTPIYSYVVSDYELTQAAFESEIDKLNADISSITAAINQMENYQVQSSTGNSSATFLNEEKEIVVKFPNDPGDAEILKEQFLIEKEKERLEKQAALTNIQNQLNELERTGDTITVSSPGDGLVKTISVSLADPIMTLESTELQAVGELTEQERTQIEQGMVTEVTIKEKEVTLEGVIDNVSKTPIDANLETDSIYPFQIAFNEIEELDEAEETIALEEEMEIGEEVEEKEKESVEELLVGYHADFAITMKESLDAVVLADDVVFSSHIWKLNDDGRLIKTPVKKGLEVNRLIEITDGLVTGEIVAEGPFNSFRDEVTFRTPLQIDDLTWSSIKSDDTKWESLMKGLLSR